MYGSDTSGLATALPFTGAAVAGTLVFGLVAVFAGLALLTILAVAKRRRDNQIAASIAERVRYADDIRQALAVANRDNHYV